MHTTARPAAGLTTALSYGHQVEVHTVNQPQLVAPFIFVFDNNTATIGDALNAAEREWGYNLSDIMVVLAQGRMLDRTTRLLGVPAAADGRRILTILRPLPEKRPASCSTQDRSLMGGSY